MEQVRCQISVSNPKDELLNGAFPSTLPLPNFTAAGKLKSSSSRLSKPRLVKQRRRRVKDSSFGRGAGNGSEANGSVVSVQSSDFEQKGCGLELKSGSSSSGSGNDGGGFLNSSSMSAGIGGGKGASFAFDGRVCFGDGLASDASVFRIGAGTNYDLGGKCGHNVCDDTGKLGFGGSDSGICFDKTLRTDDNVFVFHSSSSTDSVSGVSSTSVLDQSKCSRVCDDTRKSDCEGSDNGVCLDKTKRMDDKVFVSWSCSDTNSNLGCSSSFSCDDKNTSKFCDEKSKFDLGRSGNGTENADINVFIFRGSVNNNSSLRSHSSSGSDESKTSSVYGEYGESRRLDFEDPASGICFDKPASNGDNRFILQNGTKTNSALGCSTSSGFDDSKTSKIFDETVKMDCECSDNGICSDDTKRVDGNKIMFCSGTDKISNLGCRSSFGFKENEHSRFSEGTGKLGFDGNLSDRTKCTDNTGLKVDAKLSHAVCENVTSCLPEQMKKLNLETLANPVHLERTQKADRNSSEIAEGNIFVFGGNIKTDNLFNRHTTNGYTEDLKHLSPSNELKSQSSESETNELNAGIFVFGSSLKTCSASAQSTTNSVSKNTVGKLLDNRTKSDNGITAEYDSNFMNMKADNCNHTANGTISFKFSSHGNKSVYVSERETKLPCGRTRNDSAGSSYSNSSLNDSALQMPKSSQFSGTVKQDFNSGSETVPSTRLNAADFTFSSHEGGPPHLDQRPTKNGTCSFQENIFSVPCKNLEFNLQRRVCKNGRLKNRKGKFRRHFPGRPEAVSVLRENNSKNTEVGSLGSYSPMDFSPIQVTTFSDQISREATIVADMSAPDCHSMSTDIRLPFSFNAKEEVVSPEAHPRKEEQNLRSKYLNKDMVDHVKSSVTAELSVAEELIHVSCNNEQNEPIESIARFSNSTSEKQDRDSRSDFTFCTFNTKQSNFTFTASPSTGGPLSASKRLQRMRNRIRVVQGSYNSIANAKFHMAPPNVTPFPLSSSSIQTDFMEKQVPEGVPFSCHSEEKIFEAHKEPEVKEESISSAAASIAAHEACKRWRLRGNQAYANGFLSKAEKYYTSGVNSISPNEHSRICTRSLMLCYSNRAVVRMSLGRMREALNDCTMATAIDPTFLRVQLRAANCHLALGETEDASNLFKNCLKLGNDVSLDTRMLNEASNSLAKAQQVADCVRRSAELLQNRTSDDMSNALQTISEALLTSPYSDRLMEMKAEALLMSWSYEEVIKLCENTMESAERNSFVVGSDDQLQDGVSKCKLTSSNIWRWYLISKSYFYMGRLEEALDVLQKHELVGSVTEKVKNKSLEKLKAFSSNVQQLLHLKAAGNDAFQAGKHLEAVELYTTALACSVDSYPFAAICFCNRAAAYQALGQVTNAIADCSLATVLDRNYKKAISRRASLHVMVRDYGQATTDLNRLISILERQEDDKAQQSGALERSSNSKNDLKQARQRLAIVEREARNELPLDMYMILGIKSSSAAMDIKKAYHKAALRHHPDKSGQLLSRGQSSNDSLRKEIADEVRQNADHLFKMIGEAYAILSDSTKRMQYDDEEEMRTAFTKGDNLGTSPDYHRSYFEKSNNRRQSQEPWRYGRRGRRWSESSWSRYF